MFILITSIKCLILLFIFYYITRIITPLQFIFHSRILLFTFVNMVFQPVFARKVNLNKLPYIGDIFILVDYIFIQIIQLLKPKN